ncbi:hypothetical protein [Paracoccus pacificus]|uniref:Uncharacterized protein n=1 Tax=Paracoccus pacificus TaxID=1463598 RepID=A0ABW4R458_9RHOB
MSTTIKALALALCGWLALLALGMFIPGAAPAAMVIGPSHRLLDHLPQARIVETGQATITLSGVNAAQIYRAGAWLVLPARLPLCVDR